ncbi:hypothetical protein [Paraferrimonas sp. SM1919]|uniref:hypothetical protein n=1 Tax=Paraferrimonas sp. SM1919 TaxID=2662263 RepID=UPI0013D48F83|nr:hypothetical protein [Paraferrimonas sp. SM1919]
MKNVVISLFKKIDSYGIDCCVLRGYELLPNTVINDLDFFVKESDVSKFYSILVELSSFFDASLKITTVRQGVFKTEICFTDFTLKVDFWYQLTFVGLHYVKSSEILSSKTLNPNGLFFIPTPEMELNVSFTKEVLHNQWVRDDKSSHLRSLLNKSSSIPFGFNRTKFESVLSKSGVKQFKLFLEVLFFILKLNIKHFGVVNVFINVLAFYAVKYSNKYKKKSLDKLLISGARL